MIHANPTLATLALLAAAGPVIPGTVDASETGGGRPSNAPNFVIIIADDLGYGDLSSYGNRSARTPAIDGLATEGVRLTSFSTASAVCSPSRAAYLTGRHPVRSGVLRAIGVADSSGLPQDEITLAEALRTAGYSTGLIGKWHLGQTARHLPGAQGFDSFFGLLYSHGVSPRRLYRDSEIVEEGFERAGLVDRLADEAGRFVTDHADDPFLLVFAPTLLHRPLRVPPRFTGQSGAGPYGDALLALDSSVARILDSLRSAGIERETLVVFTSDNGPWDRGSSGEFRGRKNSAYEGGVRVPFVARWPERIPAGGVCDEPISALDVFPTILAAAGVALPPRPLDGGDVLASLVDPSRTLAPRVVLYFKGEFLQAARYGHWKLHFADSQRWRGKVDERENPWFPWPRLYDLSLDPSEAYPLETNHPEVVEEVLGQVREQLSTFPGDIQMANDPVRFFRPVTDEYIQSFPSR